MRLVSASGFLALLVALGGCASTAAMPTDDAIVHQLGALGIEGRSYYHDLGSLSSIHVRDVHEADGDLMIEDIHGHLTYVDGASLNVVWEFYGMPGPFDRAPSLTPSAVIGLSGSKLHVISRHNGALEQDPMTLDVIPSAAPVATDSTLYVPSFPTPSGNKAVYAVSVASGYMGWGWRGDADVVADMVKAGPMGGDTIYFATSKGGLYAYPTDPANSPAPDAAWFKHAHARVEHDLVVDGNDLGVVTSDARLLVMDRVTGQTRFEIFASSGEKAETAAQFSQDLVFYRCGGELRAYDRATGMLAWANAHCERFVAERGDRIILSGAGGSLCAIEKSTGKVLAEASLPGVRFPARRTPNATIYAVTDLGALVAIENGF